MNWEMGGHVSEAEIGRLARSMAAAIVEAATDPHPSPDVRGLFLTDPLPSLDGIQSIMFSGGVSEYVYGNEARDFGDMGKFLGAALARHIADGRFGRVLPAGTGIRATALGLSEYSVQLSGNTIFVSDADTVLPRRNLRVVRPPCPPPELIEPQAVADAIVAHLAKYGSEDPNEEIALAFEWRGLPTHKRIFAFAAGIAKGLGEMVDGTRLVAIVLDGDIARTLGRFCAPSFTCARRSSWWTAQLSDFDFIDFGGCGSRRGRCR